jgi:hypothetical protein
MGTIIIPTFRHQVSFVQFVERNIWTFRLFQVVVNPDFVLWNKFINVIMPSLREINVKDATHETPVNNPNAD